MGYFWTYEQKTDVVESTPPPVLIGSMENLISLKSRAYFIDAQKLQLLNFTNS